jgi:protein O-GlcNAc transferase
LVAAKARATELERALQEGQKEREALRAAVQALSAEAKEPDVPAEVQQAVALLPEGRTAEAKAIFAEIVTRKETEGQRKRAEGAADLREAAEAARHLGALAYLDNAPRAMEAYATATRLDPDHAWSWIFLGRLYQRAGNLAAAEQGFQKAREAAERAENERDVMIADSSLGGLRVVRGDLAGAVAAYEACLATTQRRAAQDPSNAGWQRDSRSASSGSATCRARGAIWRPR